MSPLKAQLMWGVLCTLKMHTNKRKILYEHFEVKMIATSQPWDGYNQKDKCVDEDVGKWNT